MKKRLRDLTNRVPAQAQSFSMKVQTGRRIAEDDLHERLLMGRMLANQICSHGIYENIQEAEFQVFSQFGDDWHPAIPDLDRPCLPLSNLCEFGVQTTPSPTRASCL